MVIRRVPRHPSAGGADNAVPGQAIGLTDEHAGLLEQVAVRADDLLAVAAAGRWPARELEALLGYLHAEILRQVADEETLLFPARGPHAGLTRLAREHARLRAGIEALERAARDGERSAARLACATRDLLCQLEHHLATEEAILAGPDDRGSAPATTTLGAHPHEWYPLTEGPVIDLDALRPDQAADAAAERLLRLRRGENVELQSGSDPYPVWQRINEVEPGHYGFTYLEDGPDHWQVLVTRRELT